MPFFLCVPYLKLMLTLKVPHTVVSLPLGKCTYSSRLACLFFKCGEKQNRECREAEFYSAFSSH